MSDTLTAGTSTCPMCSRMWTVTMWDDCLLPACGCYGHDTSAANPERPCHNCGMRHAVLNACGKMPDPEGER